MNEESIFAAALEKATPAEREAYLNEACAGNTELRAQVEELLRAEGDAGSFLDRPPAELDITIPHRAGEHDTVDTNPTPLSLSFLEPCDKPDRIGRLGIYEIIEVVGQGGMGAVLRGFDTKLSRVVAIKVMSPDLAANQTAVKRFLREARTAAAVVHDHVVTIHAIHDEHRPPYLVMEFIQGQTLQQKIDREGALELKQILRIGSQMAAGLAAAHKLGLIHRDVKPGNILLENGIERVKITDFGLARAADDMEMTKAGMIAGTPQYMSPEQAQGEAIDTRSDLFALGSVLYTMCTGRPAFRAETTWAVLRRVCDDAPRPILEVNSEIPEWLEAIVLKLLAKKPDERFQTASEVSELLAKHLAHVQNPAANPQPAPIAAPVAKEPEPATSKAAPADGTRSVPAILPRRRGSLIAAIAAPLTVFLIGLALSEAAGVTKLAATIIRITTGEGTIVVKVDDPTIKVTVDGRNLVITDAGGQEVRVRPGQHKISATKDGLPVHIDPQIVSISRGGREVVNVSFEQPKTRNPFGVADVPTPDGVDVQEFAAQVKLDGNTRDANAQPWGTEPRSPAKNSIEGEWAGRWNSVEEPVIPWTSGTAEIKKVGNRVYILYKDTYRYLIDTKLVGEDRLVGRYMNLDVANVTSPWIGQIINPERIDGQYLFGRWDFRRKVESATDEADWVQLFNGKNIDGWKALGPPEIWRVQDGNLVGGGNHGHLFTEREYENFHFRVEAKYSGKMDSGQLFRSKPESHEGYEAQIGGDTGTLQLHQPGQTARLFRNRDNSVPADTWFTQEVIANGSRLIVKLNGETLVDTLDDQHRRGHLALQSFNKEGTVYFRKIEIKELPPPVAVAPFDAKRAKEHQDAWARHLGVEPEITNSIGMKLRLIPPGTFLMGSPDDEPRRATREGPRHEVTLTKPFWMGVHHVTVGQFRAFVKDTAHVTQGEKGGSERLSGLQWHTSPLINWKSPGFVQSDEHPVVCVSWNDAQSFCEWLSKKEGRQYVLPTEAQWEYACRAGSQTRFSFGANDAELGEHAWYSENAGGLTHAVGGKKANAWGLFDMHGNAWQWIADGWDAEYYKTSPTADPAGGKGIDRVIRGGHWSTMSGECRAALRMGSTPDYRTTALGFRVAVIGAFKSPSKPNYALQFDGKKGHVAIPTLKRQGTGPLTIEARVQPAGIGILPMGYVFEYGLGASRVALFQEHSNWSGEDRLSGRVISQSLKPGVRNDLAFATTWRSLSIPTSCAFLWMAACWRGKNASFPRIPKYLKSPLGSARAFTLTSAYPN